MNANMVSTYGTMQQIAIYLFTKYIMKVPTPHKDLMSVRTHVATEIQYLTAFSYGWFNTWTVLDIFHIPNLLDHYATLSSVQYVYTQTLRKIKYLIKYFLCNADMWYSTLEKVKP